MKATTKPWKNAKNPMAVKCPQEMALFQLPSINEFIQTQKTNSNEVFHSIKAQYFTNFDGSLFVRICAKLVAPFLKEYYESDEHLPITLLGKTDDTYWNFNNDSGATNPPPPQIWCCGDTYFLANVYELQYFGCDSPPNSQDIERQCF